MSGKQHKLGDEWTCECGQRHELTGGYLAAHWLETLQHKCGCGRTHTVRAGFVKLVRKRSRKQAGENKLETAR